MDIEYGVAEAQKWISPADLAEMKKTYQALARMNPKAPIVRLIAALDRVYKIQQTA